jgi:hypothetical protein
MPVATRIERVGHRYRAVVVHKRQRIIVGVYDSQGQAQSAANLIAAKVSGRAA